MSVSAAIFSLLHNKSPTGISCGLMWLGPKRGHLTDWTTQLWVKATGITTDLQSSPWLEGPIAKPTGIGVRFFDDFAADSGLSVASGTGLIKNLAELSGTDFRLEDIPPEVRHFYQNTAEYELDAWSEWCGFFKPFGYVLARVFSHRLQQLNVPLSSLDTSHGITSRVADLADSEGNVRYTAWIRELLGSRHVLYAGSYSTCRVPNFDGCCVKVVFPLPNGNAIVIMYPQTEANGALLLSSSGSGFGSPGFYFTVHEGSRIWAKYVPAMRETIRVYGAEKNQVRADHVLRFRGMTFLRLHYRFATHANGTLASRCRAVNGQLLKNPDCTQDPPITGEQARAIPNLHLSSVRARAHCCLT